MKTIYFKSISPRTGSKTRATVTSVNWLLAELSYRCPLQCAYCSNPVEINDYQNEISTAEWKQVLLEGRELGCVQLGFSGGLHTVNKLLK